MRKNESFIQIKKKAIDPYKAAENTKIFLEENTAVYRLYDHEYKYKIWAAPCGSFDENGIFFLNANDKNGVGHTKKPAEKRIIESMNLVNKAFNEMVHKNGYLDFMSLLSAVRFHSLSLDSYSDENQLLDLWAIFETILDISNKHTSDRIQQIIIILVPLLKRNYLFSLFEQLAEDIKNYDVDFFNRIIGDVTDKKQIVQKVCEYTLLPEYKTHRTQELMKMKTFPLLKERIQYYEEKLASPILVHQFVEKHAERVKWQIMRIYRNRNLIIHNGDSMPYLRLLIENLHSYVDDFLAYIIHSLAKGNSIDSMCQKVFIEECQWNEGFSKSKKPITADQIRKMLIL